MEHASADDVASWVAEARSERRWPSDWRRTASPFGCWSAFMETLPLHLRGRRAVAIGRQPPPLHMVAGADFGRMVAVAFRTPEAAGRLLFVHGPEATTIPDALRLYCSIVAPGTS